MQGGRRVLRLCASRRKSSRSNTYSAMRVKTSACQPPVEGRRAIFVVHVPMVLGGMTQRW